MHASFAIGFLVACLWLAPHAPALAAADSTAGCGGEGQKACDFAKATSHGNARVVCKKGEFFDPRNGGECWSCPSGYERSFLPVTDESACIKKPSISYRNATKKRKIERIGQTCSKGQFWDVIGGDGALGACYSCPSGYRRTPARVTSDKACAKPAGEAVAKATRKGQLLCPKGQFFDPRNGGECWSCPNSYNRSAHVPVTDTQACTVDLTRICDPGTTLVEGRCVSEGQCGKEGQRGCMVWERIPTCDKGLIQNLAGDGKCVRITAAVKQQICKDTIAAVSKGKVLGFMDKAMAEAKKETKKLQGRLRNAGERDRLLKNVNALLHEMKGSFTEMKRIQEVVRASRAVANLFRDADLICSGDVKRINSYLERNGLKPKLPSLRADAPIELDWFIPSAHAYGRGGHFFVGYHKSLTLAVGIGATGTFSWTTDFINMGALAFSLGPVVGSDATAYLNDGITFYWTAHPADFASNGWGMTAVVGASSPEVEVGFNLNVPLEPRVMGVLGPPVGVGPAISGGFGLDPLTLEVGASYSWTLFAPEWAASQPRQ